LQPSNNNNNNNTTGAGRVWGRGLNYTTRPSNNNTGVGRVWGREGFELNLTHAPIEQQQGREEGVGKGGV